MSIAAYGLAGSVATASATQAHGSEAERAAHATTAHERQVTAIDKAVAAAGIGAMDQDNAASDRDADGRRLWEELHDPSGPSVNAIGDEPEHSSHTLKQHKDPSGELGNEVDLTG